MGHVLIKILLNLPSFPRATMSDNLTQEDINRMMAEGKVRLLLPEFLLQLRNALGPWTFKRAHVNNFFKIKCRIVGGSRLAKLTSTVGTTQVTLTCFMLERDTDSPSDDDQYLVLT